MECLVAPGVVPVEEYVEGGRGPSRPAREHYIISNDIVLLWYIILCYIILHYVMLYYIRV